MWLDKIYGDPKIAQVTATHGKIHDYLAMKLDFTTNGKLKVNMTEYVKSMVNDFL